MWFPASRGAMLNMPSPRELWLFPFHPLWILCMRPPFLSRGLWLTNCCGNWLVFKLERACWCMQQQEV